jgi:hypothetical protein
MRQCSQGKKLNIYPIFVRSIAVGNAILVIFRNALVMLAFNLMLDTVPHRVKLDISLERLQH